MDAARSANQPLVSVAVITYNQEHFLRELLASILQQDYQNLEIIIADDASTDGTPVLCRQLAQQHPERIIPFIGTKNVGPVKNADRARERCTGKYICFVSGDDLYLPGRITAMTSWMEANPDAALCACSVEVFDSATNTTVSIVRDKVLQTGGSVGAMIRQPCATPTSAFMFRHSSVSGLHFDSRTPVVADWLYIIEACLRGRYGYVDQVLLRYRRHKANTTAYGESKSYLEDRLIYTDIFLARYRSHFLSIKIQRAQIYYQHGKRCGYEGKQAKAAQFMLYALLEWPLCWNAMAGLALCSLGLVGINGWVGARNVVHKLKGVRSPRLPSKP